MINSSLEQKLSTYHDIYGQLKNALKWQVSDQRTLMMVASMYVMNGKTFELNSYLQLADYIKSQVGMFNTLKSSPRFTTAAMLDVKFDNPETKFHELLELYDELIAEKFTRGTSTYIAAQVMLEQHKEGKAITAERVMDVYREMRSKHFFLTSNTDYPLAALLAGREGSVDTLMEHVEQFYEKLANNGFTKGKDLQFLSQILSLDNQHSPEELIEKSIRVYDAFKSAWRRPKGMHYPLIGLLALLKDGDKEVETVMEATSHLGSQKHFKWHKDTNIIMAANFLMCEKMQDTTLLGTGMMATIDAIIQAQQAALIAVVSASAVTSGDGGGGD